MQTFNQVLFAASLFVTTQFASASENYEFEIDSPAQSYNSVYPNLDLNDLQKIRLDTTKHGSELLPVINRLTLDFANASDLVVNGFARQDNTYRALVNGAWVYKQILVEVEAPSSLNGQADINVRLYVVEQSNQLNGVTESTGFQMFQASGNLLDVTPNRLADKSIVNVDAKRLILKLFQNPVSAESGDFGFQVQATWLGHGEATFLIAAPFGVAESSANDAVALRVEPIDPSADVLEFQVAVEFIDGAGILSSTDWVPLRDYLTAGFPGM